MTCGDAARPPRPRDVAHAAGADGRSNRSGDKPTGYGGQDGMDDRSWPAYRIEHHRPPAAPAILGYCHRADRAPLTLAPYAAQLLDHGETGAVVLINQATAAIIAVRHLVRFPFRA